MNKSNHHLDWGPYLLGYDAA